MYHPTCVRSVKSNNGFLGVHNSDNSIIASLPNLHNYIIFYVMHMHLSAGEWGIPVVFALAWPRL